MAQKEAFQSTLLGLALVFSFMIIVFMIMVSIVAAQLPPPPPTPTSPENKSAGAPPTPGTPGAGDDGAPPAPGTPPSGSAVTSSGGVPSGDSGGVAYSGGGGNGGDYARRHAGEGYTYAEGQVPSDEEVSAGEIATSTREAPPTTGNGYNESEEQQPTEEEQPLTQRTELLEEKKGYVRIAILLVLILLAVAAIIWAIMRWKTHKKEEDVAAEEIEAAEKGLYLYKEEPSKKPAAKSGPLPPGMR